MFAVVADVSSPDAFNKAVKYDPPLDAVIHTASPFHFNIEDPKDFLDPAVKGTVGLLNTIKREAPTVKRVVSRIFHRISSAHAKLRLSSDSHFVFCGDNRREQAKQRCRY